MGKFVRIAGTKRPERRRARPRPVVSGTTRRRRPGGPTPGQDRSSQPKLPRGAIIADLSKHAPHNSYGPPEYYVDQTRKCRDCGKEFTWTAKRQQYWFEVLKIPIHVQAVRCAACGRKLRLAKEAQRRHMAEMARRPRHPNEAFLKKARPAKKRSST